MLTLEQVRALEARVEKAVAYIGGLREENASLKAQLAEERAFIDEAAKELDAAETKAASAEEKAAAAEAGLAEASASRVMLEKRATELSARASSAETRVAELAAFVEDFRRDQSRIEEGIVHALEKLDAFEDLILGAANAPLPEATPEAEAEAPSAEKVVEPTVADAPEDAVVGRIDETAESASATEGEDEPLRPDVNELDIF
ncbi:MAG: hypothetical protein Q8M76_03320 [Spirochaetaceae bacterium]|nr:hypothetical protein [Spirochaetaceae bacterium]